MDTDERFMMQALHEALKAGTEGEVPVGAVIVHKHAVIGRGRNACERLKDPTAHAEMLAITAAAEHLEDWRLEDCTLYVTLEPCPMCMGAALNARLPKIVYGADEPKAGACGSIVNLAAPEGFNHTIEVIKGCLQEDCAQVMKAFFRELRLKKKAEKSQSL